LAQNEERIFGASPTQAGGTRSQEFAQLLSLFLPMAKVVVSVGQYMTNIDLAPLIMNDRYKAIFVSTYIKNSKFFNLIRRTKCVPNLRKALEISMLTDRIPSF
jgi:hypothetical protein